MKRWILPLLTLGAVLLAGWMFYRVAWVATRSGTQSPLYSTQRFDPYGAAALYRLLRQQGLPVSRLQRPDLSHEDAGVLFQIVPASSATAAQEWPDDTQEDESESTDDKQPMAQRYPAEEVVGDETDSENFVPAPNTPQQKQEQEPRHVVHRLMPSGTDHYALSDDEILSWVRQGNVLVQLSHHRTKLMDMAGVPESRTVFGGSSADIIEELQRSGAEPDLLPAPTQAQWTMQAQELYGFTGPGPLLRSPLVFTSQGGREGWEPLLTVGGEVVAGQIRLGQGRVVVIGAPTPALNQMLGQGGNLPLMLKLAGEGPVIFDAWSHEPGQTGTLMGLIRQFGLLPMLLQLVLLMVVYHWSTQGRRRELPLEVDRPRSSVEQILTLGYLYDQAMDAPVAAIRTAREVQHRVAKGLSCTVEKIPHRLEQRDVDPARAKQARELLAEAESLRSRWSGRCWQCGYDFKTNTPGNCPGCGHAVHQPPAVGNQSQQQGSSDIGDVMGDLSRLLTQSHAFATGKKP